MAMGAGEGDAFMGIGEGIAEVFTNPPGDSITVEGEGFRDTGDGESLVPEGGYLVDEF